MNPLQSCSMLMKINSSDKNKKLKLLESVFKEIAYRSLKAISQVKLNTMNKEFHAIICNADVNQFQIDKEVESRYEVLKQQLQHQIDHSIVFKHVSACLIHNTMTQCKNTKCEHPHVCSLCADADHVATDPRCPKAIGSMDWYFKRMNEVHRYHSDESRKSRGHINHGLNRIYQKYSNVKPQCPPNHGPGFNNQSYMKKNERE